MSKEVIIEKLEFPHNIRTRQGMYGSSGEDADILLREIIDNAVDVVMKNRVSIDIAAFTNLDGYHMVWDTGTGVPIYADKDHDNLLPITIDLLTQINVGSNFHKTQYSAGMNGVGSKLTNALSTEFVMYVNAAKKDISTLVESMQSEYKSGKTIFKISFKAGILEFCGMVDSIDQYNSKVDSKLGLLPPDFGTLVLFSPDSSLLTSIDAKYHGYPFKLLNSLMRHDPDFKDLVVNFHLNGKLIPPYEFKESFKTKLIEDKVFEGHVNIATNEPLPVKFMFEFAYSSEDFLFDAEGSVNLLRTSSGKHITLFQQAMGRALNRHNNIILPSDAKFGLRAFVLTLAIEPLFNSQDKTKLSKFEDKGYDDSEAVRVLAEALGKIIKSNSEYFDFLCSRIIEYKKAMQSLSNIDLLKSKFVLGGESEKHRAMSGDMARVYEALSKNYASRELYVTEGLSASQGIVELRNKQTQSCLPLRGKLTNSTGFDEEKLADSREILALINTVGCGIGAITDVKQSRYNKIIIATDSDSDGNHIANLITALFFHHAPDIIRSNMLYKLETPYYRQTIGDKVQYFYYSEKDKIDFSKGVVRKLKGLGSWNNKTKEGRDAINKYMCDPNHRKLIRITLDDINRSVEVAEAAKLFSSSIARRQTMIDAGIIRVDLT